MRGVIELGKRSLKARLLLYVIGLGTAVLVDPITPRGATEWLIEVAVVCIAAMLGRAREMTIVAWFATVCVVVGLFTGATEHRIPFWLAATNRLAGILVMWIVVFIGRSQRAAEAKLKILQGMLPICASCKRIRGSDDRWQTLESYITEHSEASFSHSLCPQCLPKYVRD